MVKANRTLDNALENKLDYALKSLHDLGALNRSPLARYAYIERLAKRKYNGRILPRGLALREVIRGCIRAIVSGLAGEQSFSRVSTYLVMSEKGISCGQISQQMGLSREHVSRHYRKMALELLADEYQSRTRTKLRNKDTIRNLAIENAQERQDFVSE